ncbi:MAG TPA: TIR domain-containing protein [Ktedonobacteraceae bacterium]|jgi:WD40 repeat protein|nr:TIR domain-containing protein [Ktedonobacteraceae bacterium]
MASSPSARTKVFVSYSREDSEDLERLRTHLARYVRENRVDLWDDTKLQPGAKRQAEIQQAIQQARVAILLISADFLASDFIAFNELPPLLAAAESEGVIILPVLLKPCNYQDTALEAFEFVNPSRIPLSAMNKTQYEATWAHVTKIIANSSTTPFPTQLSSPGTSEATGTPLSGSDQQPSQTFHPTSPKRKNLSRRTLLIAGATTVVTGFAVISRFVLFAKPLPPAKPPPVGTRLNTFEDTGGIRALTWSPDGRFIATANDDSLVPVWDTGDTNAKEPLYTYGEHTNHVEGVSWSPDGKYIVSGSADGTARIWNAQSGKTRYIYHGHTEIDVGARHPWVNRVQWSPDGTKIVSCDQTSSDSLTASVQVWSAEEANMGEKLVTYSEHKNGVYAVAWSPNNKYIASVGYDGVFRVWEAVPPNGNTIIALSGSSPRWLFAVTWSPDGKQVVFGGNDYTVWQVNLADGSPIPLYTLPTQQGLGIRDIAWSHTGNSIAVSTNKQGIHIIQAQTGILVQKIDRPDEDMSITDISALGWSPTHTRIASGNGGSAPYLVQLWQAPEK